MYLQLGQNAVIRETDVIGVFDLDNTTGSHITRKFLSETEKAGRVVSVSDELPNAFIVCDTPRRCVATVPAPTGNRGDSSPGEGAGAKSKTEDSTGIRIYISQLSSQTLLKRFEALRMEWLQGDYTK